MRHQLEARFSSRSQKAGHAMVGRAEKCETPPTTATAQLDIERGRAMFGRVLHRLGLDIRNRRKETFQGPGTATAGWSCISSPGYASFHTDLHQENTKRVFQLRVKRLKD